MPARAAPRAGAAQPDSGPRRAAAPARPPHRAFLDLGAVLTAPGCARAWTREILWEWGAAELADAAELVTSELVTNSVNACDGLGEAAIRLVLTFDHGELAVLVRDNLPGAPGAVQPGADDESGRGLLIVEHLSDRCGWYPLDEHGRAAKVTWAVISEAGRADGEPPAGRARPADSALPVRRPRAPMSAMRTPTPIDPDILARVKAALERL